MTHSPMKMASLWLLVLSVGLVMARPQVEVVLVPAEHRLGDVAVQTKAESDTRLDGAKQDNQTASYAFSYVVSSDASSTYIAQRESREGAQVHGQYSYVDPNGALITVQYKAGPDGYAETRTTQHDFHALREKENPKVAPSTTPSPSTTSTTTTTTTQPPPPNSSSQPEVVETSSIPSSIASEAAAPSSDNSQRQTAAAAAISSSSDQPESAAAAEADEQELFLAEDTRLADNSLLVDMILSELRPLITETVTRVLGTSKRARRPTPSGPPTSSSSSATSATAQPSRFSISPVQLQQQEIILPVSIIDTTSDLSAAAAKDAQADEVFAHTRANTIRFQNPDVKFVAHI